MDETADTAGHEQRRIVSEGLNRLVDGVRFDERLVPLEIDDEIAVERRRDFGDAVSAGLVSRTRQSGSAAETSYRLRNTFIVGGDDDRVDRSCGRRSAIHVLDHRPAGDIGKRLAGKPGGRVARRDDSDSMCMILKRIADAFGATCGTHDE